jgi:hypothetical protein
VKGKRETVQKRKSVGARGRLWRQERDCRGDRDTVRARERLWGGGREKDCEGERETVGGERETVRARENLLIVPMSGCKGFLMVQ